MFITKYIRREILDIIHEASSKRSSELIACEVRKKIKFEFAAVNTLNK